MQYNLLSFALRTILVSLLFGSAALAQESCPPPNPSHPSSLWWWLGEEGVFTVTVTNNGTGESHSSEVLATENGEVLLLPEPTPTPLPTPLPTATPTPRPETNPLASLGEWEQKMVQFGAIHCRDENVQSPSETEGSVWYYDGARIYYRIAEYTGEPFWNGCAEKVNESYREYVLEERRVPGWRVFPHGLAAHHNRTGDSRSREAVLVLANESAFAPAGGGPDAWVSRETAYLIQAFLASESLGEPEHPNLPIAVDYALGHLAQWRSGTASSTRPFMIGLTLDALIEYYEVKLDPRIPDEVKRTADWLREESGLWRSQSLGYLYDSRGSWETPDLNMLLLSTYSWLHRETGEAKYLQHGDELFEGGLAASWLEGGKHFSQAYRFSIDYAAGRSD